MRGRTWALLGVGALVAGGGAAAWYLAPIGPIATGYAAEIVCNATFLQGRAVDEATGDLPDNPLVPLLRVGRDADHVSATLLGAYRSTAWFTPGQGCTLAEDRPDLTPLTPQEGPGGVDLVTGGGPEDPERAAAEQGLDPQRLEAALAGAFAEPDDPDLVRGTRAVVVARGGQVVAERYADGFDASTPLLGWSATKSVASAMVGRLVHQGVISVDDDDLWPGWRDDPSDPRRAITVEQLLTMTDGLEFEEVYDPDTDATRMLFTPTDTGEYAAEKDLESPPGATWEYSSGTTNLLCDVAVLASGLDAEVAARELVFGPLGMDSAVIAPDAAGDPVCSSFGYATARDWARFGQLYLDDGTWGGTRLLPEGWVEASTTPVEVPSEAPYGWQWWLNQGADGTLRMPQVPADAFWASGNEGQQVVVLPSQDLVVVRLGLSRGYEGIAWGLADLLVDVLAATEGR